MSMYIFDNAYAQNKIAADKDKCFGITCDVRYALLKYVQSRSFFTGMHRSSNPYGPTYPYSFLELPFSKN